VTFVPDGLRISPALTVCVIFGGYKLMGVSLTCEWDGEIIYDLRLRPACR